MSYSSHTVPSSQSSDEDKSPVVTCEFQAVLRTLHLTSTVPLQAAPCTTPDSQGGMALGHCCGFLGTPVNWASCSCFTVLLPHQQQHPSALPGISSPRILALLVWLHKERGDRQVRHCVVRWPMWGELERRQTSRSLARMPRRKVRVRRGEQNTPTDPYKPRKGFAFSHGSHQGWGVAGVLLFLSHTPSDTRHVPDGLSVHTRRQLGSNPAALMGQRITQSVLSKEEKRHSHTTPAGAQQGNPATL